MIRGKLTQPINHITQLSVFSTYLLSPPTLSLRDRLGGPPHPVTVTIRDSEDYVRGPIVFLLCHHYRVRGPPKI